MKKYTWGEAADLMIHHGKKMEWDHFLFAKYIYYNKDKCEFKYITKSGDEESLHALHYYINTFDTNWTEYEDKDQKHSSEDIMNKINEHKQAIKNLEDDLINSKSTNATYQKIVIVGGCNKSTLKEIDMLKSKGFKTFNYTEREYDNELVLLREIK